MPTQTLELYTPHEIQRKFHESKARYRVASLGRQAGKSTGANQELAAKAWENPRTHYWFISPTYDQAEEQYNRMLEWLPEEIIKKKHDSKLRIQLINGSTIRYRSGDAALRGATLHGVIIDEVRDQPPSLWSMVIQPMLRTTKGWASFISTPNGFDSFYDLYSQAKSDQSGLWEAFTAPSTCNPLFTQEELEEAKSTMSDAEFRQEIMAEFLELGKGKVYINHGEWNQRTTSPFTTDGSLISPYLPILIGLDFNVNPMSWHLGQTKNKVFYWYDRIYVKDTNTEICVPHLIDKVRDHKLGVVIVGDSTGKARKSSATENDYQIIHRALKDAGIPFRDLTPRENPLEKDRVTTMNMHLKSADGTVRFFYHPINCPELKKDLERVAYKEGSVPMIDKTSNPELTHSSDSVGYPVCELGETWKPSPGLLRVVRR